MWNSIADTNSNLGSDLIKEHRMKWYGHPLRLNEKTPARLALKEMEGKVKKPKGG